MTTREPSIEGAIGGFVLIAAALSLLGMGLLVRKLLT